MNKEQAIKILDQAISQIPATRQSHEILIKALQVLAQAEVSEKNEKAD